MLEFEGRVGECLKGCFMSKKLPQVPYTCMNSLRFKGMALGLALSKTTQFLDSPSGETYTDFTKTDIELGHPFIYKEM